MNHRVLDRLPIVGVLAGIALLGAAVMQFPGGYRLSEDTISALFQRAAPNGAENTARPLAVLAVFTTMGGIAVLFHLISRQASGAIQRHTFRSPESLHAPSLPSR